MEFRIINNHVNIYQDIKVTWLITTIHFIIPTQKFMFTINDNCSIAGIIELVLLLYIEELLPLLCNEELL